MRLIRLLAWLWGLVVTVRPPREFAIDRRAWQRMRRKRAAARCDHGEYGTRGRTRSLKTLTANQRRDY